MVREQRVGKSKIPKYHSSRYMPPWLQGLLGRKFHNSPMNGWLVPLWGGLQLDTSSLNCSPVSQAAFQGCQVLQALHRAVDFKVEFRLFSDPSWAADRQNDGWLLWCSCFSFLLQLRPCWHSGLGAPQCTSEVYSFWVKLWSVGYSEDVWEPGIRLL